MTISVRLYLETVSNTHGVSILSIGAQSCTVCKAMMLNTLKPIVIGGETSLKEALCQFNTWLSALGDKKEIHILGDWFSTDNTVLLNAYRACQITPHFGFIWQTLNDENLIK